MFLYENYLSLQEEHELSREIIDTKALSGVHLLFSLSLSLYLSTFEMLHTVLTYDLVIISRRDRFDNCTVTLLLD